MKKFGFEKTEPPATSATSGVNVATVATVARGRLSRAADHYGCDRADLLDWYRDDLPMIADMPSKTLAWAIEDYLKNRNDIYRQSRQPINGGKIERVTK